MEGARFWKLMTGHDMVNSFFRKKWHAKCKESFIK